jgi:hypothetical protein
MKELKQMWRKLQRDFLNIFLIKRCMGHQNKKDDVVGRVIYIYIYIYIYGTVVK